MKERRPHARCRSTGTSPCLGVWDIACSMTSTVAQTGPERLGALTGAGRAFGPADAFGVVAWRPSIAGDFGPAAARPSPPPPQRPASPLAWGRCVSAGGPARSWCASSGWAHAARVCPRSKRGRRRNCIADRCRCRGPPELAAAVAALMPELSALLEPPSLPSREVKMPAAPPLFREWRPSSSWTPLPSFA